jgi:hypothetical protein
VSAQPDLVDAQVVQLAERILEVLVAVASFQEGLGIDSRLSKAAWRLAMRHALAASVVGAVDDHEEQDRILAEVSSRLRTEVLASRADQGSAI